MKRLYNCSVDGITDRWYHRTQYNHNEDLHTKLHTIIFESAIISYNSLESFTNLNLCKIPILKIKCRVTSTALVVNFDTRQRRCQSSIHNTAININ